VNHPRTFVAAFLALMFVMTLMAAAINVIVDPFWRFAVVKIPGFNAAENGVSRFC
jgi:hypothetical protein